MLAVPENVTRETGHNGIGRYEDIINMTCTWGYVTSPPNGPAYVTPYNYRQEAVRTYNTTCDANGDWSPLVGCTSRWNISINYQ